MKMMLFLLLSMCVYFVVCKYLWVVQMELSVLKFNHGLTEMEFRMLRTLTMICVCVNRGSLQLQKSNL